MDPMLALSGARFRALANLSVAYVCRRTEDSRQKPHTHRLMPRSEPPRREPMRHRTAVKTGRSPGLQAEQLRMREGSFARYTAMAEGLAGGYVRSLQTRLAARKPAP
jgi:hypothetical protein